MDRSLRAVLVDCLGVADGEDVLVVCDASTRALALGLVGLARALGAEAVLADMAERVTHGAEPPPPVAAAMLASSVVVAPTTKSLSHTEARRAATARGARIATLPGITEDMLRRTMAADHGAIRQRARAVAGALTGAERVRVTSPAGTDVTFVVAGRPGLSDDGDLSTPGAFGNLPAGEGFVAPVEGATNGRIVFDGSIWPIGMLDEPLVVEVVDGYATRFSGPAAAAFEAALSPYGRDAFAVAELGIGVNDAARLTGNVLEDEKVLGTIHVAFGDNHTFGGSIRVPSHQDGIVLAPTVHADDVVVVDAGTLVAVRENPA